MSSIATVGFANQIKNRKPADFDISFFKYIFDCRKFYGKNETKSLLKRVAEKKLNRMLDVHKVAKVVSNLKIMNRLLLKDFQRKMLKYSKYN